MQNLFFHNNCNMCGECCKTNSKEQFGVLLFPQEIDKFQNELQISKEEFFALYCFLKTINIHELTLEMLFLKMVNGHCIFLDDDNKCKVYAFRPLQCQKAPYTFLAKPNVWKHMPCVDMELLNNCNSKSSDLMLIQDLLAGY